MTALAEKEPAPIAPPTPTVGSHLRDYISRVRGGDIGPLPAILGLVVLCTIFSIIRPAFLTPRNFANLFTQGAPVMVIAMGLIFVLLLGEIDLSAGFASGVSAAVMAMMLTKEGWPWYGAVLAAIVTGLVIGFVLGFLVAKVGVPSFVVTLAAFLAFQGLLLLLIGGGKNVSVSDPVIRAIENSNLPPWLGWTLTVLAIAGYAAVQLVRQRRRAARGLVTDPTPVVLFRIVALAVVLGVAMYVLNLERSINTLITSVKGAPIVIVIVGALLVGGTFLLGRTAYGRHLYAVGGNAEAARRAGINVDRIRISVFVIGSTLAAIGGIILASKGGSVDPNTGGSNTLLYAVGAAVIDNGMGLLNLGSGEKFVATGVVLLLAAGVDALSRRRAAATGNR